MVYRGRLGGFVRGLSVNVKVIGVGRFRILGGQGLEYWRGQGGPNSQQAHAPTRFLINQCQIITFLIFKSDIIENSRIELRGIVLPAPSNQSYYYY